MVRIIGFLVGLGFVGVLVISLFTDLSGYFNEPPQESAEYKYHLEPKEVDFSSDGPFGRFDDAQLQRGYQVYREVCAACHGLQYVAFRNLEEIGYTPEQVKSLAANEWEVPTIDPELGEETTRAAIPSDTFPNPYPNAIAARAANNNAYPPDLSLIVKAREGGAPYIYSLLTGYQEPSKKLLAEFPSAAPGTGLYHNPYFANLNIAMPPPITSDGQVTYGEGAPEATVEQMAKDVTAFLIWTAEPRMESRKRAGIAILIFLSIATLLAFLAYRNVWAEAKRQVAPKGPLDPENMAKREQAKAEAAEEGRGVEG
ncbi:cytochrome c1 [Sphingomicrobium lutaoense]|uniref:Cytochrome c1 n=1 Tax=Sphingomicrobium lutaoense TaxID=515949 RepID=A0A839Z5L3_9SPHN|nr:cytochrome c1 [Sphingomicrobium lutaoense]MBB3763974.1 ubiquinol-cytochrome c reductase cytochrome c1 subunit [Sphingomicrobium lutaoense]